MTMGRLKIRNAFLDLREMRVAFFWESRKKIECEEENVQF